MGRWEVQENLFRSIEEINYKCREGNENEKTPGYAEVINYFEI